MSEAFTISRRLQVAFFLIYFIPNQLPLILEIWRPTPVEVVALLDHPFGLSPIGMRVLISLQGLVLGAAMSFWMAWSNTLVLTDEGITLKTFTKFRWQDVASARLYTFFGKRLNVRRVGRRFGTHISLDLVGPRPLAVALEERAPPGNPIRECLASSR
jgi:hypothetical protein